MEEPLVVGGQLGNYLIDSVIGRGGMSTVYRARHARLGMQVALKVLAPELSSDDAFRERFLREAQAAAGIDHPNVIPIHDLGLHGESLYIVMRYVAGGDLRRMLKEWGTLEPSQTLSLLGPAALALDAAHAHELVHRDFKPANVLVQRSEDGSVEHVYLTDFGIVKRRSDSEKLTRTGVSIGTVGYMSPEQFEGREVNGATDVYSLAATLYECLTGRVPYERELAEGLQPPAEPPVPVARLRPELGEEIDPVITRALSRDPAERQASCRELIEHARAALEDAQPHGALAATVLAGSTDAGAQEAPAAGASEGRGAGAAGEEASERSESRSGGRHRPVPLAAGALAAAALAVIAIVLLSRGSGHAAGTQSAAALGPVPTNRVTGSGSATLALSGDTATVTVRTNNLDGGAALTHLMHIHTGGRGECPPASAARLHNGHLTISTTDGINYYGPPAVALTTHGDTSPASILAFPRYETGGWLGYTRKITLPASVAKAVRDGNAVVVIHGIDYDGSGIYSGVLERSELDSQVPATATAPALCGVLSATQTAATGARGRVYTAKLDSNPAVPSLLICQPPANTPSDRRRTASSTA